MKKLLILGATRDECQIVYAAREMGVYTITTDNHLDWKLAPAKYESDEAWNISWADIEVLSKKCTEAGVDGVIAGYSEFRTNCAMKLCNALGLPFYLEDEQQLTITRNKSLFKKTCRTYGVPVPRDYSVSATVTEEEKNLIQYPVVVKPVDNAGSRGIKTCFSKDDLQECIDYALSYSESKQFIVEELLIGHEITCYYVVADGKAVLSTMQDKYARIEGEGFNSLPDAYLYPSRRLGDYQEKWNNNVIKMLEGMGIKNGVLSLQGFAKTDGSVSFFELGFRLGGSNAFIYTDYYNHVNHLKMLIHYSLYGDMGHDELKKEDPSFKGKYACIFTLLSTNGVIGLQEGNEKVRQMENVLYSCFYHTVGDKIVVDGSQFPKTHRTYIVGNSIEEIQNTIRSIQSIIKVQNTNGDNMLYPAFDVRLLEQEFPNQ